MNIPSNQNDETKNGPVVKRRSRVFRILGVVAFGLIVAAIIIPHQLVSRVALDEISAVKSLRALNDLEARYAAAHPSKGFACEFAQLKTEAPSNGEHINEGFLFADSSEGYRFSLTGCEVDRNGVVVRYKATAVPLIPGKTGVRAFCTDQTRELRFGVNESVESCRPL